jgi:peroxiredoxin
LLILAAGVLASVLLLWLIESNAILNARASQDARIGGAALAVGAPAPDFRLLDHAGNEVRLSDYRGQRVLLNFWATWCPPCRAEMRDLDQVAREGKRDGVRVLAVDQLEADDAVQQFVAGLGVADLTVLLDSDGRVGSTYRVTGLPTSFFIDQDGLLKDIAVGPLSRSTAASRLESIRR